MNGRVDRFFDIWKISQALANILENHDGKGPWEMANPSETGCGGGEDFPIELRSACEGFAVLKSRACS
jgi:hypothetical protein